MPNVVNQPFSDIKVRYYSFRMLLGEFLALGSTKISYTPNLRLRGSIFVENKSTPLKWYYLTGMNKGRVTRMNMK